MLLPIGNISNCCSIMFNADIGYYPICAQIVALDCLPYVERER